MFESMENLKITSSFHKAVRPYGKKQSRPTHGFIIKIKGCTDYFFENKSIRVNEGQMIFLPKNSSYYFTSDTRGENLYTSINFDADLHNPAVKLYSLNNFYEANYLYESFTEHWNFGNAWDKYKCLSVFYDLLSYISKTECLESSDQRKYSLTEPAVEYLKKHIYDSCLKINKLHTLCGISDTYFRKIFISRFNMTPQEYVVINRVSKAKSIIESGDYATIKEVSELVGYNDPLYFSKAFRKVYGFCPSDVGE